VKAFPLRVAGFLLGRETTSPTGKTLSEITKMASEKIMVTLDSGVAIKTTKDGWNDEVMKELPAQAAGWKEGAAPHFSVGMGFLKAVAEKGEHVVGNYVVGETEVPIIDAPALTEDILNTYAEAKGLDVQKIRIAGSRTGAKKQLESVTSSLQDIDPAALKILEASNPEAYATLMNLQM